MLQELAWDPVDGMHAEKQLPTSTLKSMFESGKVAQAQDPKAKQKKKGDKDETGPPRAQSFRGG